MSNIILQYPVDKSHKYPTMINELRKSEPSSRCLYSTFVSIAYYITAYILYNYHLYGFTYSCTYVKGFAKYEICTARRCVEYDLDFTK